MITLSHKMKSLFIGTRIEALEKLREFTNVVGIVTIKNSFVDKNTSQKIIIDKDNKNDINSIIENSDASLIFSSGYPFILSKEILLTKKIFLNSHPSYLPFYKGRYCIKRAYENNEEFFGFTLHHMSEKVDSGKIVFQKRVSLKNFSLDEVYQYLFSKCEIEVIEEGLKKL